MNRFLFVILAAVAVSACDTVDPPVDPEPVALATKTASNVYAPVAAAAPGTPASGGLVFYSLRQNRVVLEASSTTRTDSASTNWDIAFRGTDIFVNGGTSGPGQGQAAVLSATFDEVTAVPTGTTFRTDGAAASTCSNNIPRAICGGSAPANTAGWYTYTGQVTNLILPTAGRTILVRTADGAGYAKVRIQSYYQNAPETPDANANAPRYYSFDYVLNPSGTSFQFEGEARTSFVTR